MKKLSTPATYSIPDFAAKFVRTIGFLCLLVLLTTGKSGAQVTLAAWNPSSPTALSGYGPSPWSSTTTAANVTIGGLTRGSGVSVSGSAAGSAWGGSNWQGTSEANAISINEFATFTVKANSGYSVSLTGLSLFYRRSGTGPSNGQLQYSTDGTTFTDVSGGAFSYTNTTSTGALLTPSVDLSGITALQTVPATTTITFRIVNWGGTSSSGTWYVFNASGLQVIGTVNSATSCSGTPSAGTASGLPSFVCGSGTSTLTLTGGAVGTGLSYQWSSSSTSTPPGTNISGATNTNYTPASISATTYYWCTTTCAASSLTNISSVATIAYNSLPSIGTTPSGGNVCSGGAGLGMTASGGVSYTWAPAEGLSATTGASVIANPGSDVIYTVTGTALSGCSSTNMVTVTSTPSPSLVNILPSSLTLCQGDNPGLLSASGGTVGPASASSGPLNLPVNIAHATVPATFSVSGIPSGAVITSAVVTLNFSSSFMHDYMFNLAAPNGNIINLVNQSATSGAGSFTNTIISSAGSTALSGGVTPYTGTFAADAASGVGPASYLSNVTAWPALYSVPNGAWTLVAYNSTTFADVSTLLSWSLTLNYSYPASVTWSSIAQLYTNSGGTISYTGGATNSVYLNPLVAAVTTYTATATNGACTSSAIVTTTVNPVSAILGIASVCPGSLTALSDAILGGAWMSGNTLIATVGSSSGFVSGVSDGAAPVTYTSTVGCKMFKTVTVNPLPAAISGATSVCVSAETALSDVGAGTWTSSNTTNAAIDPGSGIVTGLAAGTTTITFVSAGTGCSISTPITVNPLPATPAAITGTWVVCEGGATISLSDTTSGGVWSSVNTANATIDPSGTVTGVAAGTSLISYTYTNSCGSAASIATVTINPLPATPTVIVGTTVVCEGGETTLLSDTTFGGVWSSTNTAVGTVDISGNVTGVIAGTTTISYTNANSCGSAAAFTSVTVNPLPATPAAITGVPVVCEGGAITSLSDATTGGAWSSTNTSVETVDVSGNVTGLIAGTAIVSYTYTNSCGSAAAIAAVTVNPLPATPAAITGTPVVCAGGATTALSDTTSAGVWSSTNTLNATVDISGTVTGLAYGTSLISYTYTNSCGSAAAMVNVTINPLPVTPAAITGTAIVCEGGAIISLSDTTAGGAWSSSATANATVDASGNVTGITAGTSAISYTYTNSCGSLSTTTVVTVNPLPVTPAGITGITTVCAGGATTALTDVTSGGVWSSINTSVATVDGTGLVTGVSDGTTVISYTKSNSCGSAPAVSIVTVDPLPVKPVGITGTLTVCEGGATTAVTDGTFGGGWSSGNTSIATIDAFGTVTGVNFGIAVISYTYTNSCGSASALVGVTVNPLPVMPVAITGVSSVCEGGAMTVLSDATIGGTWSSLNTLIATITPAGLVTGVSAGTSLISYTYTNSCGSLAATDVMTVNPLPATPASITGFTDVCVAGVTSLSDISLGGAWSSGNTIVATVDGSGNASGLVSGVTRINYVVANSCGSAAASTIVTVVPLPYAGVITGAASVCTGSSVALTDATFGGVWSSSSPIAVVAGGVVTGVSMGADTIRYSVANMCGIALATKLFTVDSIPVVPAIAGPSAVCVGSAIVLSDSYPGGVWHSSNSSSRILGGILRGLSAGLDTITYRVANICGVDSATTVITINSPAPALSALAGPSNVCVGAAIALSDAISGGTWATDNGNVTVSGGVVKGIIADTSTVPYAVPNYSLVTYSVSNSCGTSSTTKLITIDPLPTAFKVMGGGSYCSGGNGVYIYIDGSDPDGFSVNSGVYYELFRDTTLVTAQTGFGYSFDFGLQTGVGTYKVVAVNRNTGCSRNMTGTATVALLSKSECNTEVKPLPQVGEVELTVLPNPNNGEFFIKGSLGTAGNTDLSVVVTNMLGQVVHRSKIIAQNGDVDQLIHLDKPIAKGMYLVTVRSEAVDKVFHVVVE